MSQDTIRIGLIGAGGNVRSRHIPGFRAQSNVEIVSVANRTRASGQAIADEFGIAKVCDGWEEVLADARQKIRPFGHGLFGYDKDFRAVKIAQQNALAAYLEGKVSIERKPFERLEAPAEEGLIVMNPPYDERIGNEDIGSFYQMIGDRLKQAFSGYEAWVISSNYEAFKRFGLRPSRKIPLFNGSLECRFQKYELYSGSRKQKYQGHES